MSDRTKRYVEITSECKDEDIKWADIMTITLTLTVRGPIEARIGMAKGIKKLSSKFNVTSFENRAELDDFLRQCDNA